MRGLLLLIKSIRSDTKADPLADPFGI